MLQIGVLMVLLLFILVCGRAGSMLLLTALHSKLTDYIILPIRFTVIKYVINNYVFV